MEFNWFNYLYDCLVFMFLVFAFVAICCAAAIIGKKIYCKIKDLIVKYRVKFKEIVAIAFMVLLAAAALFTTIFISIKGLIRSNGWQRGVFSMVLFFVLLFLGKFTHDIKKELYHNETDSIYPYNARSRLTKRELVFLSAVYMLSVTAPTYVVVYTVSVYCFRLSL